MKQGNVAKIGSLHNKLLKIDKYQMENSITPRQRAQELVIKFGTPIDTLHSYPMGNETSKQCALICVDEILCVIPMYTGDLNCRWTYWQQVKQEIGKL